MSTRDTRATKAIRKSLGVHGEVDGVKLTPRESAMSKATLAALNKKGVKLSQEQLLSILNILQNPVEKSSTKTSGSNEALNKSNNRNNNPNATSQELDLANYPTIDSAAAAVNLNKSISFEAMNNLNDSSSYLLPSEKKRLKWQKDKGKV